MEYTFVYLFTYLIYSFIHFIHFMYCHFFLKQRCLNKKIISLCFESLIEIQPTKPCFKSSEYKMKEWLEQGCFHSLGISLCWLESYL